MRRLRVGEKKGKSDTYLTRILNFECVCRSISGFIESRNLKNRAVLGDRRFLGLAQLLLTGNLRPPKNVVSPPPRCRIISTFWPSSLVPAECLNHKAGRHQRNMTQMTTITAPPPPTTTINLHDGVGVLRLRTNEARSIKMRERWFSSWSPLLAIPGTTHQKLGLTNY